MKKVSGFYCDIVPIMPIPPGKRGVYTYLADSEIPRGSLVSIPFRSFTARGVVLDSGPVAAGTLSSGRLKRVTSIMRESFLTESQISLAESISHDCLTSLGKTLKHFLPSPVTERVKARRKIAKKALRLNAKEREIRSVITKRRSKNPIFLESDMMTALRVLSAGKRAARNKKQFLVLVPESAVLPFVEHALIEIFSADRIATLESRRSDGAFFSAWERIRSGEADIIVGTRQAVFAPFKDISHVLVFGEGEVLGYKQWDMSPRYDARRLAEKLTDDFDALLIFSDTMPSLDMRHRIDQGEITLLPKPAISGTPAVDLVNMREERWKKNRSIISEAIRTAVSEALTKRKKSVLIASRGGLDSFSVCESCRAVPRCPECDRALRSTQDGHFTCPSCAYRTTSFPRCRECGSLSFRNVGSGTEKIETELSRAFPGSCIVRLDEAALRKEKTLRPDTLRETLLRADILVGTPVLLNVPYLPETGLIAIMDTDNFLSLPDFRGDERFLRMVSQATSRTGEYGSGKLILQTFHPERVFFDHIRGGDLETQTKKIALDRESLRYPPYRSLFRIGFRDRSEQTAIDATEHLAARLSEAASDISDTTVSPPMKPLLPKKRGRYERFVLVNMPEYSEFPETMRDILLDTSGNWFFEPDPLSIL